MQRQPQIVTVVQALALASCFVPLTAAAQPAEGEAQPEAAEPAAAAPDTEPAGDQPAEVPSLEVSLRGLFGRPGGLTSDEVGRRAAKTSLMARAYEQQVLVAAAQVDKTLMISFPRVNLIARYTRLSDIDEPSFGPSDRSLVVTSDGATGQLTVPGQGLVGIPMSVFSFPTILNQYHLQASLTVPLSDYLLRTPQAVAAAEHIETAAKTNARAARLADAAKAKAMYYNWVRTRLQLVVAEQSVSLAKAQLDSIKLVFEAGRASKADILRAESQVASAQLLVERARNLSALTEDQVRTAMHDPKQRQYQIGEDITAEARRADQQERFGQLYSEALRQRLELRALERTMRSLRQQHKVAKAGELPRLDAFANAYLSNPHPRYIPQEEEWRATWDAGLQLSWSPNDLGTWSADARIVEAQRARLEAEKRALEDGLRAEVLQAHHGIQEARLAFQTTERGLKAAEEGYRVRRQLLKYGRATSVEVIDAQTNLLRAQLDRINAHVDLLIARVQLDHAVGRDVKR